MRNILSISIIISCLSIISCSNGNNSIKGSRIIIFDKNKVEKHIANYNKSYTKYIESLRKFLSDPSEVNYKNLKARADNHRDWSAFIVSRYDRPFRYTGQEDNERGLIRGMDRIRKSSDMIEENLKDISLKFPVVFSGLEKKKDIELNPEENKSTQIKESGVALQSSTFVTKELFTLGYIMIPQFSENDKKIEKYNWHISPKENVSEVDLKYSLKRLKKSLEHERMILKESNKNEQAQIFDLRINLITDTLANK